MPSLLELACGGKERALEMAREVLSDLAALDQTGVCSGFTCRHCGLTALFRTQLRQRCGCEEETRFWQDMEARFATTSQGRCINYFGIEPTDGLPHTVTIGYTRQRVAKRLGDKGGWLLIRIEEGTELDEKRLHKRFEHLRIPGRGERFRLSGELLDYLADDLVKWIRERHTR